MDCNFIEKLRSPRIFGLAIFDWTFSLISAFIIGYFLIKLRGWKQWGVFIIFWILFGIVVHVATKTPTMMNYYLGLSGRPVIKKC